MVKRDIDEIRDALSRAESSYLRGDRKTALALVREIELQTREYATPEAIFQAAAKLKHQILLSKQEHRFRVSLIVIFVLSLAAVTLLATLKVSSTEVEMAVSVHELSFTLSRDWPLFSLKIDRIGISGLDDIEIDPYLMDRIVELPNDNDGTSVQRELSLSEPLRIGRAADAWNVNIEAPSPQILDIRIPKGTSVSMAASEESRDQYRLRFNGASIVGAISPPDTFSLTCSNCRVAGGDSRPVTKLLFSGAGGEIGFRDLDGSLNIVLVLSRTSEAPYLFGSSIFVNEIDFTQLEGDSRESTISGGGAIYFSELDGKYLAIREGDYVVASDLDGFQMRRMSLNGDVTLSMHGRVGGLKTGTRSFMYERRPSRLEWLSTNRLLGLLLGILLPVVSTVMAVLYRLKVIREV